MGIRGKKSIACITLIAVIGIAMLTGCDAHLKSSKEVAGDIEEMFPDCDITSIVLYEETENPYREYHVTNNGINFITTNYLYDITSSVFGGTYKASGYKNNYMETIYNTYRQDIDTIANSYGVKVIESDGHLVVEKDIININDIGSIGDAVEDLGGLLGKYLPTVHKNWFNCSILGKINYGMNFLSNEQISFGTSAEVDGEYAANVLKSNILKDIKKQGITPNDSIQLTVSDMQIVDDTWVDDLEINGEQYISDEYNIDIVKNYRDGEYYIPVGFGVELDYNGGVRDNIQCEIIEKYYPDCQYTIDNDNNTSSYIINGRKFTVKDFEADDEGKIDGKHIPDLVEESLGIEDNGLFGIEGFKLDNIFKFWVDLSPTDTSFLDRIWQKKHNSEQAESGEDIDKQYIEKYSGAFECRVTDIYGNKEIKVIPYLNMINEHEITGATYYHFIKLSDFAYLMNMSFNGIRQTESGSIAILSTN